MASAVAKLAGKVAIVTASTEGIGFAIARRLGQDGAKVMISSRKQQNVEKALAALRKENLNVEGMVCHVGKKEDRQRLFKETVSKYGGIDILVSNAAVSTYFGPTLLTPEESFDKMFDINVKSSFMLCQEAVPEMVKRGSGSIVLITSIAGYVPFELIGVYSITKTALLGIVKALSPELAKQNIRINGLAPGIIKTKFSSALTSNESAKMQAEINIPMGRLGEPEDCSGAVSFLVSDDSKFMTGETIVVAGGATSRL
ncbi:dehydrogenase/reductase SDR family member 4-like [Physella acuta]|uniref:dehydrogenase/reductase SDR family member 4-like n=1 Tax=Physella acuta TaxID=109671 RepID=UPI0027DD468C|nr:dehydrogenase/reductase SDR family member 4-like [Physella acuta]XP_059148916.1 dehydrogenase/reductase SDR family member 4-like [Physella acuta]